MIATASYEVEGSSGNTYRVDYDTDRASSFRCGCPDMQLRGEEDCKHIVAARLDLNTRARKLRAATEIEVEVADEDYGFDI